MKKNILIILVTCSTFFSFSQFRSENINPSYNDRDITTEENKDNYCEGIYLRFNQQYGTNKYTFAIYNNTGCTKKIKYKFLLKNIYGEWVSEKSFWGGKDIVYEYTVHPGNTIIGRDYEGKSDYSKVKWLYCKCI